jgi:hypothetical protein
MRRLVLAVLAASVLPAFSAAPDQDQPTPPPTATCTFVNASYSGKCVETTEVPNGSSPQRACESILRCLNDVGCVKTYCQATTIRSGWRLESAK